MEKCCKKPLECTTLDEVRNEIDRIDREIIGLIGERYTYVREVAKYKAPDRESIFAKERYEKVIENRGQIASENGLDPKVIQEMYRIMLDYFIEKQVEIKNII